MTPSISAVIRSLCAFAVLFLVATPKSWAKVEIHETANTRRYLFSIEDIKLHPVEIEGKAFVQPTLEGVQGYEGVLYRLGKPELPVLRFFLDGEATVVATAKRITTVPGLRTEAPLKPSLPSVPKMPGERRTLVQDVASYRSNAITPHSFLEITPAGSIQGRKRSLVTVYPVAYRARTNEMTYYAEIGIEIQKEASGTPRVASKRVALVIPQHFVQSDALLRLGQVKAALGYEVHPVVVTNEAPAQIRGILQGLYQNPLGLRSALLVGDVTAIPSFPAPQLAGTWDDTKAGVTDHYYRSMDAADFMQDINGPDIGIGRWSVTTEAELGALVDKTLRYAAATRERAPWLSWMSFIASDDTNFWKVAEGSLDYAIDKYTSPLKLNGDFPAALQAGGDRLYAITHKAVSSDVQKRLQSGRGFINYGGHGSVEQWEGPVTTKADVESLNTDSTPIVVSNACLTGRFVHDSFAETWIRHPRGAVFFLGSMSFTYWDEDDIFQRAMYDSMFRDKQTELSQIFAYGLSEVWRFYGGQGKSAYYWETYVSFGDPDLRMRVPS